jgi:hypothetical protein
MAESSEGELNLWGRRVVRDFQDYTGELVDLGLALRGGEFVDPRDRTVGCF